jgi:hypothetical protein
MHAAMTRIAAMAVLVVASMCATPSAYATIGCEPSHYFDPATRYSYQYCCQFRDSAGPTINWFKLARCQYPCNSAVNSCRNRFYCNAVAAGVNCSPLAACGFRCSASHIMKSLPGTGLYLLNTQPCETPLNCGLL